MKPYTRLCSLLLCWMLIGCFSVSAQEALPFNGLLLDALGRPIRNARVWVNDPDRYARTDKKGRFGLTDVRPADTLRIRPEKHTYDIPVAGTAQPADSSVGGVPQ